MTAMQDWMRCHLSADGVIGCCLLAMIVLKMFVQ